MEAGFGNIFSLLMVIGYVIYTIYKAVNKEPQQRKEGQPHGPLPPVASKPGDDFKKTIEDLVRELSGEKKQPELPKRTQTPATHQSHIPEKKKTERKQSELEVDYSEKKKRKQTALEQIPKEEPHLQHHFGKIHDIDELPADHSDELPEIMGVDARKAMIFSEILKRPEY